MMSFRNILAIMALAAAAVAAAPSAYAGLIPGSIDIAGLLIPVDSSNATTTLSAATGVKFLPGSSHVAFGTQTGDLTAIADGNPVTLTNFQFDPFVPVLSLYTSVDAPDTASFDLLTLAVDVQLATN